MYEIRGRPLIDPNELLEASQERQTSRVYSPCIVRIPFVRSNWVFREVTPAGHSSLKTDQTHYRE